MLTITTFAIQHKIQPLDIRVETTNPSSGGIYHDVLTGGGDTLNLTTGRKVACTGII